MLTHFAYGAGLIFGTTFIHFACTLGVLQWVRLVAERSRPDRSVFRNATLLAAVILAMSVAAIFEAGLWAAFYVWVGALPSLEDALYFSLVTFTTLGYGDIVMNEDWRLLAAFEAANGIILFGWTTAIIVYLLGRMNRQDEPRDPSS